MSSPKFLPSWITWNGELTPQEATDALTCPQCFLLWAAFSPSTSNLCFSLGSTFQGFPTQELSLPYNS